MMNISFIQSTLLYSVLVLMCYAKERLEIGEWEEETGFYQSIEVRSKLFETQSQYQKIQIYDSKYYGNVLVLDGVIQLTQQDGNSYNEMMAHMPMFQHPNPKRALVIGGGDGYVLSEVCYCLLLLTVTPGLWLTFYILGPETSFS